MKFDAYKIDPRIKKSLADLGFRKPTDIQYKSIPSILAGEDLLAIAQTGTGKTAAFAIPLIDLLLDNIPYPDDYNIRCLVLAPTRELAQQIAKVFTNIAQYVPLTTVCITGGVEQQGQIDELNGPVDILVATPGRMFDLIYQKHIKITKVKFLVLDEADQMLDLGFYKDILDVKKFLPKLHQTLFFSATINDQIKDLAYSLVRNPIRIQLSPKERVSRNITHSVAYINMDDKRFFLERIVKENSQKKIIVFVRTQVRVERVAKAMERVGITSIFMHGGMQQDEREKTLNQLREGTCNILVTTDVVARGIDIPYIYMVINYDIPEVVENYVHRVGRTGRGNDKGYAISFCSLEEKEYLTAIEEFLGKEIDTIPLDTTVYDETLFLSDEEKGDWKSLIQKHEKEASKPIKKKKK
jgi:ATP-dependent RNA helicase RhlE